MFCNSCGAELRGTGGYCNVCGAPTGEVRTVATPQLAIHRPDLKGVGGWLYFFCIVFTIIRPIAVIAWVMPRLSPTSAVTYLLLLDVAFGMLAGVLAWREQPEAVPVVKAFLIFAIAVTSLRLFLYVLAHHADAGEVAYLYNIVLLVLWFSYFRKSVRVRNTYGRNI